MAWRSPRVRSATLGGRAIWWWYPHPATALLHLDSTRASGPIGRRMSIRAATRTATTLTEIIGPIAAGPIPISTSRRSRVGKRDVTQASPTCANKLSHYVELRGTEVCYRQTRIPWQLVNKACAVSESAAVGLNPDGASTIDATTSEN